MKEHLEQNDNYLILKATQGESEAFGLLFDKYSDKIYRFIYFKISHKEEAEDLTANVFFKAWHYLTDDNEKEIRNIKNLLFTIARNLIIDWYRNRAKKQEVELKEDSVHTINEIANKLDAKVEADKLMAMIRSLKQDYQELIVLRFIEELSVNEIAKILNKSQVTVRVTLHRAMKKLKQLLGESI